jgi:hypothetical protein
MSLRVASGSSSSRVRPSLALPLRNVLIGYLLQRYKLSASMAGGAGGERVNWTRVERLTSLIILLRLYCKTVPHKY